MVTISEVLKQEIMNSHEHNAVSIGFGSLLSIFSYIAENPFLENGVQLLKVIIFGIVGGAFGYLGRLIAIEIHKKFKK